MSKVEINVVAEVIKAHPEVEPATLRSIIENLSKKVDAELADEDEKAPTIRKQFVILVSAPENRLPATDFVGWVLQIPENESVATTQGRIFRAAYDFNATKKGRLLPAKTVGEAIEAIPAKHFREADLWVKTKTPVLLLRTENQIPREIDNGRL